jgi:8-oxo-dGTP pyrophosphatase MutT (NUDIX family)
LGRGELLAGAAAGGYWARMRLDSVREQLSGYTPADSTEAAFVQRMLELSQAGGACERSHFEPGHFTASAFVLSPDRRDLVLIHHKKLGIWVQPGGHVEPVDDDLIAATRREVQEEVGLGELELVMNGTSLVFDVDIHRIPARKAEPAHEHFDVRFAFVAKTRDLVHSEEVADLRWVPLSEVEQLGSDDSVLRAVRKLRALRD